jgi:hypothetical protein
VVKVVESAECKREVPLQMTQIYKAWATKANLQTEWITPAPQHQCQCSYLSRLALEKVTADPLRVNPGPCKPDPLGQRPWAVKKTYDVLVTSSGGVGTSFILNTLGSTQYGLTVNEESNGDDLKHHPWPPPADLHVPIKSALFIYDDPVDAVLSLYRRGFHLAQGAIISNRNCPTAKFPRTVDEFVRAGANIYPFREFFQNWLHQPTSFPVAFVRLSDLWEHLPELCAFLRMDEATCVHNFPPKKDRASSASSANKEAIAKAYSLFSAEIDALPRFFVKPSVTGETSRME